MKIRSPQRWMGAVALLLAGAAHAAEPSELPLSGAAYRLAQQAHQAYDSGDYALAVDQAREALRLRPDVARLRQLLDNALAAQRQAEAEAQAGAARPPAAFRAAERAYKAYGAHDFAGAAAQARRAVALAPGNAAYRVLLVNALASGDQVGQAAAELDKALAQVADPGGALAALRRPLRLRLAGQPLAQMYRALERNDPAAAADAAREAVALVPDLVAYRLLLVQALARAARWDEARDAATEALKLAHGDGALLAMRGYLHQRAGDSSAAQADFNGALWGHDARGAAARNIALIGADAALAAGQPQRALDLLAPFAGDDGAPLQARAGAARADLARLAAGEAARAPATSTVPELECRTVPNGQDCTVLPAAPGPEPGFPAATEAYAAIAALDYERAVARAREALAAAPGRRAYRLLLLSALQGARRHAEAETLASALLAENSADAGLLVQRAMLRKQLRQRDAAREDFAAALQLHTLEAGAEIAVLIELERRQEAGARLADAMAKGELARMPDLDIAYLAARAGNDALAIEHFQRTAAGSGLPPSALLDTAYAALRAGANDTALDYFKRSGEAVRAGQLALDETRHFAVRRAVAELSRSWGIFAGISYRGPGALPGIAANGGDDSVQAGLEAYWRPFGTPHGRTLELFARAYQTVHGASADASGSATLQPAAGVRVKPFGASNLFLSVSRLAGGGSAARTDWLAQASYFHGRGTDLRPQASSWWTTQVTAELGHYFSQRQDYGTVTAQFGRSWRPSAALPNLILIPHLVLAHDYNSANAQRNATGSGPGATLRYWFRENVHSAPRSYLDLTLQYRARISGDARGKGLFFNAVMSF